MALPISPISTDDVRGVLGVTGTSSFGDLCNNVNVVEAGLNATYCPDEGAGKLANLHSTPYALSKFRGYDHSVVPVVDIWKLVDSPIWVSGGTWTYNQWANSFDPINNGVDVSFGFDSSFGGYYYDASITYIPSWITVKNIAGDALSVGSTVRPFANSAGDGGMKVWPNSANGGVSNRTDQVTIANNYSGTLSWTVTQGYYIPPPSINDHLTAEVSVIYPGSWPASSLLGSEPDQYIRMFGGYWYYVLKITNVSTNTINFGSDVSINTLSKSNGVTYSFFENGSPTPYWLNQAFTTTSGAPFTLPASIAAGSTWESPVIGISGPWDSGTSYFAPDMWLGNEWWPFIYFKGTIGSTNYDNVVLRYGNTTPALIHQPAVAAIPSSYNFPNSGGSTIIDLDFDPYWWDDYSLFESIPWASVTPAAGLFTINCDQQSTGGVYRSGNITVSLPKAANINVFVSQDASLSPGPFNISINIDYVGDGESNSGLYGVIQLKTSPGDNPVDSIAIDAYYKGGTEIFYNIPAGTYYIDFNGLSYSYRGSPTSGSGWWKYAGDLYWNYQNYTDPFTLSTPLYFDYQTPH